ncbi:hypothetical protein FFJ24_021535 [Pedobacter sp. KBS0701]|uniref:hypothetical protein n=1 Tax=Pedobacter sp. KBS0701 TaxID=2578106 RepID=UPI00110E62C7|nr:hypothetical protein [Pedobacter sp. KBS0701]QDW27270.1 hypothetical protein FFJ24_021535 [Pedobacter sp. KBS0701]
MRRLCLIIGFVAFWASASAQLNVELLHQLVAESKSEHERQAEARNNQTLTTGNEAVNKTSLTRLKEKYRDIQSRFKTLGVAISAAQIGIEAYPLVSDIITQQGIIFDICSSQPLFIPLAIEAEADLGDRAYKLLNYLYGLALVAGDLNQMKPADRKMLFSFVLTELRAIAGASRSLAAALSYATKKKATDALNPFSGFINQDRAIIDKIIDHAKQLGQ